MKKLLLAFVLALPCMASAQSGLTKFGDWEVDVSIPGLQFAITNNASNAEAGVFCLMETEECRAFLSSNIGCNDGALYPLMINSPLGAVSMSTQCLHLGELQLMIANDFDAMISVFESGGEIGFALPMENGQFRVMRFSTTGATAAIKQARTRPEGAKRETRRLKNETL